jgi:GT2 family glycosyltransferase
VIFASKGRPEILAEAFSALADQTLQPGSVIISGTCDEDAGKLAHDPSITFVKGRGGLTRQRNMALRRLPDDAELVVFFDDDFVPHRRWLEAVADTFRAHPDVVAFTGNVITDGVAGAGLSFQDALQHLERIEACDITWIRDFESPYGCNMAFRRVAIEGLEFDERLVDHGWLEDLDFGAQVARRGGRLVKIGGALGVHRGVKLGRVAGRNQGYAQVINPFYLRNKGTITTWLLAKLVLRHLAANLARSVVPDPHVDRISRLRGNFAALCDVLRGKLAPERAGQI